MESMAIAAALSLLMGSLATAGAQPPATQPTGAQSTEVRAVQNWLRCEECSDGELQALLRLGTTAVPLLGSALRDGPPQAQREENRQHLVATYRSLTEYARTHPFSPVPMTEAEYVQRHMDHYVDLYQTRAARGLGAIGGPDAKKELTQALDLPLPPDVLVAVRESLAR